ncbi:hypothetical protein [Streptomyces sp. NPDC059063]|uniref:hypothetical protein n=1 Tax=Streptomyces sp. NPDC059063 TaxID=3346712 RepID=UPI003678659B
MAAPRPPDTRTAPAARVLDWSLRRHWASRARPCRYCDGPATHLRDSSRKPAHKVCAEEAIARQDAERAEAYENERINIA